MATEAMELRYHHAMPGWCKIIGLKVRPVPKCEGGGFKVEEKQARLIAAAPELLEAAEEILARNTGAMFGIKHLRDAVAKATGATP